MKLRHSVLFFALVLLFGALTVGAAPIEKTDASAAALVANSENSAAAPVSEACASKADPNLQIAFAPNLSWLSTSQNLAGKCGTCGDSICNGQTIGAICGFDGSRWYACINLFGNFCPASTGGKQECFCTTSGPY